MKPTINNSRYQFKASLLKIFKTPIWMTIYSDMMTNLTLFFMLAFALTRIEKNMAEDISKILKAKITGQQVVVNYEVVKEKEQKFIENLKSDNLKEYAEYEIQQNLIKLTLREPILFELGSSEILDTGKKALHNIALVLKDLPNTIIVEGHTDDLPMKKGTNWELSLARAINVVDYFVNEEGIDKNKFMIIGYGEYKPLVPNNSPENRAKNRRIEINIVRY